MTANLQLQINGNNIENYNIYQNSDLYATAVATNVTAAELISGYQLTLNNASTFVRLVANGACGTYKDISINFSDPTPSIAYDGIHAHSTDSAANNQSWFSKDGKGKIVAITDNYYSFSPDNGDTWSLVNASPAGSGNNPSAIFDKNGDCFIIFGLGPMYRVDNFITSAKTQVSYNLTLPPGDFISNYFYWNGIYYIRTYLGLYRSLDNIDYVNVLNVTNTLNRSQYSFVGYGNVIYHTIGTSLYKSIDDGVNWALMQSSGSNTFTNLYVENENNVLVYNAASNTWLFSVDGGTSFSPSWLPTLNNSQKANIVIKSSGLYYYQSGSSCGSLNHTTSSPFLETEPAGNNYTVPSVNIIDNGNFKPGALSIGVSNNRLFCVGSLNTSCSSVGPRVIYSTITAT